MTLKDKFQAVIDQLLLDPYLGEPQTGDLSGIYCCDIFYSKISYELAYTIIEEDEETVVVILAGTRENFYEELKPSLFWGSWRLGLSLRALCRLDTSALRSG